MVTIGSFDGVHRGHQALVAATVRRAAAAGASPVAVTFEPHPRALFNPERAPQLLTLLPEKVELLGGLGITDVVVIAFDHAFADRSPREFIAWLEDRMDLVALVCGPDFAFGRGRAGNPEWLREHGHDVVVTPAVEVDGHTVHSSPIRGLLGSGEVEAAAALLGRPYRAGGRVVRGHRRGHELGFPTANLDVDPRKQLPGPGAYAGFAEGSFGRRPAAMSVGHRPTFGGTDLAVEAHLLDFDGDLYEQHLEVEFHHRLHPDIRFASVDELVVQIGHDVDETRRLLAPA